MIKILALDPIHEDGLALLRARADIELIYLPSPTDTEIAQQMQVADVLLLRGRTVPVDLFQRAQRLRLVSRHGVGCDNLDFDVLRDKGITVTVSADANLVSVAEHAFMLMLAASKKLIIGNLAVRSNGWSIRDTLGARDIQGSRILVLGFGRIGQAVAARALAFGAQIAVYDPFLPKDVSLPTGCVIAHDLGVAVAEADIVSIHMPRTDATTNLFGAKLLSQFAEGSILVNTARGGIVDETALVAALDAGRPAIYASDVLSNEPPRADNPLLLRDDVILTPHSAAMTQQAKVRMALATAQNVLDYLDGCLDQRMIALDGRQA